MSSRALGNTQALAAAKAGLSERTGRTIEHRLNDQPIHSGRHWRTRLDPFAEVWEQELIPLLESAPSLSPLTLLEYLQEHYDDRYPDNLLRSLQRRVKQWKALFGPDKEVMFRQRHEPGRLGLSDFTQLKEVSITIHHQWFEHLLYHFRLACSGWSHIKVIQGGESFSALAEGLQEALWRLGGVPLEHRTDSFSAAFKNLTEEAKKDMTDGYQALCDYYRMKATRNNPGNSHENGSIESPHGHIKHRIKQALLLRGSSDFTSIAAYQEWLDDVVNQHNRRNAKSLSAERAYLQALPTRKTVDFVEVCARVSSSATIDVRRVTYTVPSRLEGENLRVHLHHDRLECYLGSIRVIILERIYPVGKLNRVKKIDYRHVIHSLIKKPQAFRYSQIRDDLLPNPQYKAIWKYLDENMPGKEACKWIVGLLYLAAQYNCEEPLAEEVLTQINQKKQLSLKELQQRYTRITVKAPVTIVNQHRLSTYNILLSQSAEVCYA